MKLCELAAATDLLCRRSQLLDWQRALKRGDIVVSIGGTAIGGPGVASLKTQLEKQVKGDIASNAEQLAQLGVEVDDSEFAQSQELKIDLARPGVLTA